MSNTIRQKKTRSPRPVTRKCRQKVAVSICDCGNLIEGGEILCIECEVELEMFNGFSMDDLAILEEKLEEAI